MNAFGTPNAVMSLDICGWGRAFATRYTYGVGSVGIGSGGAMPDIANSGCLILWGYNPSISRLTHATATVEALKRGMKLIVVDPRHAGLASKADIWLRVRPGTDGALALGIANLMIRRGWFDRDFIRTWSNGPLLVRADTGRLVTERDLSADGDSRRYLAWDSSGQRPVPYDRIDRALRRRRGTPRPRRRIPPRYAAGRRRLPPGLRTLRRALPPLSTGSGRSNLLDPAGGARKSGTADLGIPPRLLLRLERA